MTEQDKFLARFEAMKALGLVDMKFFVRPGVTATQEEFFADANRIQDEVAHNQGLHNSWPSPDRQYDFAVDAL